MIDSISGDCLSLSDLHNVANERMTSLQYMQTELICVNAKYDAHFPDCRQTVAAMEAMISGGSRLIRTREFAQRCAVIF